MNKIQKLKMGLRSILAQFAEISTDKGLLSFDGEEIKVDDLVYTLDDEGNRIAAADGDYAAEDGRVIRVADGKVVEIVEKEETVTEEFKSMKAKFEETYDEKYKKIDEAVREKGVGEFYIVEAGDDHAVVCVWEENTETLYKYPLTWNEDGSVTLGEAVEVKQTYVPVEEVKEEVTVEEKMEDVPNPDTEGGESDTKAIEEVRKEIDELYDIVDKLIKEVDKLKNEPAAESAEQEFKAIKKKESVDFDDHHAFLQAFASAKRK